MYASYEKKENGLIDKGVLEEKEENQYGMDFQNLEKTKGCIRFETEDGKEERIVFEAKYNIDVSVQSSPCLHLLRPKEKKRNSVIVQNNGILNTGPIVIQAKVNDDVVRTMEMQDIPYLCSVHFDYEVQPEQEGTLNIYVSAVLSDEKEICLQDNEEFIQLHCTEEPVYRIGLLTGYMFDTSFGDKYMSLQKLNQEFEKVGQNIEIQTISCYYNENDEVSFDTMGFDALILLDCLWFNNQYYAEPFYTILSRFVNNGGKLFGINSLDYIPLQNWAWTEGMQPLFGIRSDVGVAPYLTQYPLAELTFSGDSFLEKNSYKLWNSTGIRPSIKKDNEWFQVDWSEEFLLPGAKIVASSDQTGLSLLQYKENVFLYTGYFHNMCFEKEPDTFQFFSDMLQYLSEPSSDPSIKGVTIDKPDTIRKGDELQVSVEIKNNGNKTTSPIKLKYDNGKTMEVDKFVWKICTNY